MQATSAPRDVEEEQDKYLPGLNPSPRPRTNQRHSAFMSSQFGKDPDFATIYGTSGLVDEDLLADYPQQHPGMDDARETRKQEKDRSRSGGSSKSRSKSRSGSRGKKDDKKKLSKQETERQRQAGQAVVVIGFVALVILFLIIRSCNQASTDAQREMERRAAGTRDSRIAALENRPATNAERACTAIAWLFVIAAFGGIVVFSVWSCNQPWCQPYLNEGRGYRV